MNVVSISEKAIPRNSFEKLAKCSENQGTSYKYI